MNFIIGFVATTVISKSVIEYIRRDIEKRLINNNYEHLLNCERKLHIDSILSDQYTYFPLFNITIAIDAITGMDKMYESIVETDEKKVIVEQKEIEREIPEQFDYSIESDLNLLKKFKREATIINQNSKQKELDLSYFKNWKEF